MELIKIKDGLIEADNFYLASSFSDFAGSSNVVRDIKTGKFKLISNNKIERNFDYDDFVIELEKENFTSIKDMDYSMIYLSNDDYVFGIRDNSFKEQNKYWKILKQGNYIQAYSSSDGFNYTNIGGANFNEPLTKQGFMKHNIEDFILNDYKVYANPYITIINFPKDTLCELYDSGGNLLKSRLFDSNLECEIFIDGNIDGYFIFKDVDRNMLYTTGMLQLRYGNIYVYSTYSLEIIYRGNVVTNVNPALLQDLEELITIKNIGNKDYRNITIGTETRSNDLIQLSFDGVNYSDTVTIDSIKQGENKDVFVKIIKNTGVQNFARDFQLVIND